MWNKLNYFLFIIFLFACEKAEDPVVPHNPGNVETTTVEVGSLYDIQAFYDLGTNQIMAQNQRSEWDISLEGSSDGTHILLNSSVLSYAAIIENMSFESVQDTLNLDWKWDSPDGNLQDLALPPFSFLEESDVIVIDCGVDEFGVSRGIKKFQILNLDDYHWEIRHANLDNTENQTAWISKGLITWIQFSFVQNEQLLLQPSDWLWDLLFTTYTEHLLTDEGDSISYLVVGVLLNRYNVLASKQFNLDFSEIDLNDAQGYALYSDINVIGYDWKIYDFDTGFYTIDPSATYILSDTEGYFYKLRFIDFYNENGEKGSITFEYQLL